MTNVPRIRLIADHHTYHDHGTELVISRVPGAGARNYVDRAQARKLVASKGAEFVGDSEAIIKGWDSEDAAAKADAQAAAAAKAKASATPTGNADSNAAAPPTAPAAAPTPSTGS